MEVKRRGPRKISVLYPLPSTNSSKTKKQRTAAYCRVSSASDDQLASFNAQIQHYEKEIKENPNYIFSGIYADEGISGTSLRRRDAFNRMLQDAKEGKLDLIITKSLSRFGRNTVDFLNSIRELKSLGVDVYFEKENIHTMRSEGEMLLTLISAVAQNESITQSENVKWGKHRKFEKGDVSSIPWKNIMGYEKCENGKVAINEEQAVIIRKVYKEFLGGLGLYEIAKGLNEARVPLKNNGQKWTYRHILNVLTNEKYKGCIMFQKYYVVNPLTHSKVENKGELPQYYFEDTHPAIIDKNIWECVQLELERQRSFCKEHFLNNYHYPEYKNSLPLTGKIFCGTCGHLLKIKYSNKVIDKGTKYYTCKKHQSGYKKIVKPGSCVNGNRISPSIMEEAFIKAWNSLVEEFHTYSWEHTLKDKDVLRRYRTKELLKLVAETGYIDTMSYELMIETLDHIIIATDGKLEVIFLAGKKFKL